MMTLFAALRESVDGTKRRLRQRNAMSAIGAKADLRRLDLK
jgi:hypothetical protein